MQESVLFNSYSGCVECSALCRKDFPLNKRVTAHTALKMVRFVRLKHDSEVCENNIKEKPSKSGTKPSKVKKKCTIIVNCNSVS